MPDPAAPSSVGVPLRLTVPPGWRTVAASPTTTVLVRDEAAPAVPASLVVTTRRVAEELTLDDLAARLRAQVARVAGAAPVRLADEVRRVAGHTAVHTVLRIPVPARALTLVQAQTALAWDSTVDNATETVQIHLTCRDDEWPQQRPVLDAVLGSLTIG